MWGWRCLARACWACGLVLLAVASAAAQDQAPAAAAGGSTPTVSTGPKFDCAKGFKPIERLICQDPEIWPIENETFAAWRWLRKTLDDGTQKALLANQRVWIRRYPERCGLPAHGKLTAEMGLQARDCVMQSLKARTAELKALGSVNFVSQDLPDDPDRAKELQRIIEELQRAEASGVLPDAQALAEYSGESLVEPSGEPTAAAPTATKGVTATGETATTEEVALAPAVACSCADTYCAEFSPARTTLRGRVMARPPDGGTAFALRLDEPVCLLPDRQNGPVGPQQEVGLAGDPGMLGAVADRQASVSGPLQRSIGGDGILMTVDTAAEASGP